MPYISHHLPNSKGCPLLSIFFCLIYPPASALCNYALFVVDPISRFDPSCSTVAECLATQWLTDTKAYQQAGINVSALPIIMPTHPFARMNSSLSACLALNQDPLLCLYDSKCRRCPSYSSITLSTAWSKEKIGFTLTQWAAKHSQHYHRSQLTLFITQGRQQTWEIHHVRKTEATLWRAIVEEESGDLPWQIICVTAS